MIEERGYRRPKLQERFVRLYDEVQSAERGHPFDWTRTVEVLEVQNIRDTTMNAQNQGPNGLGLPVKLLIAAFNYTLGP
jgi:hypothetical protein